MKNKKGKLLGFSLLALCFACMAFGVYALKNATLTVTGTVGFTAHDCMVKVVALIEGDGYDTYAQKTDGDSEPSESRPLNINGDSNQMLVGGPTEDDWTKEGTIAETIWFTDLTTDGKPAPIIMTFNLTNQSAYAVYAKIANVKALADKGVSVEVTQGNVIMQKANESAEDKTDEATLTATFTLDASKVDAENGLTEGFELKLDFGKYVDGAQGGGEEGGEDVGGEEGGEEQETTQLATPIEAVYDTASKEITITEVENADKYEVSVYEGENLVNTETVYGTNQILNTSYSLKTNTTYDVKAKALGDNVTYTDSELSETLTTITITEEEEYTHNRIMSGVFGNGLEISKDETGAITEVNLYKIGNSAKSMLFTDKETYVKTETAEAITFTCESDNDRSFSLVKDANGDITEIKYNGCAIMSYTANEPMTGVITRDNARNCTKIVVTQDNEDAQVPLSAEIYVSDSGLILEEKIIMSMGTMQQNVSMIYLYDDYGYVTRLINKTEMYDNGALMQASDNYIDYEYDANHNMVAYKEYANNNELRSYVEAQYNADNKITTIEEQSYSSQTHKVYTYTYDENGDLASETVTTYNTAGVATSTETIEYTDNKVTGSTKVYCDEAGTQTKKEVSVYEYTDPNDVDVYTMTTTIYDANNNKVALSQRKAGDNSSMASYKYYSLNEKEFTLDENNPYKPGQPYRVYEGDIDEANYRYNSLTTWIYETDENGNETDCQKMVDTYVYDDANFTTTRTTQTYNSSYEEGTVDAPAYESKSVVVIVRDADNNIVSETTTYYSVSAGVETKEWTLVDNKTGTIERTYYNSDGTTVWYVEVMTSDYQFIEYRDAQGTVIDSIPGKE